MPIQPSHHVSSQEFQNPDSHRSVGANYAKRTQFPHTKCPAAPDYAKRTQFPCTGTACRAPKMRNEPNSPKPTAKKCETNPIPARPTANRQQPTAKICETNPITTAADLWKTKKCETNPICHPANSQKQTANSYFYETNPISVETPNLHSTIYNIQSLGPISTGFGLPQGPIMRNEPNLPPRSHRPTTQEYETNPISLYGHGMPCPKNAKQTQFHPPSCLMPLASCPNSTKQTQSPRTGGFANRPKNAK